VLVHPYFPILADKVRAIKMHDDCIHRFLGSNVPHAHHFGAAQFPRLDLFVLYVGLPRVSLVDSQHFFSNELLPRPWLPEEGVRGTALARTLPPG